MVSPTLVAHFTKIMHEYELNGEEKNDRIVSLEYGWGIPLLIKNANQRAVWSLFIIDMKLLNT